VNTKDLKDTQDTQDTKDTEKKEPLEQRIHSSWLNDYIKYASFQESPSLFHKWTGISIIAGALNRNVYIQRGYNRLYPNLYTVLVSPTGKSKKSSAANIGVNRFLSKIDGMRILRDETTPKGLVQYLSMAPLKRDGTKIRQDCTAFIYATELSDLLGEQSYNLGLIKKLTALWDCPDIYDDTTKELLMKNKVPTRLTNVCLNLYGCSNPEWLAHGLKEDSFGGGFMGRTLFVFSIETNKTDASAWMDVPSDIALTELTLLRDLHKISQLKGNFTVEDNAKKSFIKMYKEYDGDFTGRMAGYLERKLTYVLKLAMILSINYSDDLYISNKHINEALSYLEEIEKVMPNAFVYINATNEARISQHIIESIRETGGAGYRSVLVEKFMHLVRNIREFDDIIQMLIESHVLKQVIIDNKVIYMFMSIWKEKVKEQERLSGISQEYGIVGINKLEEIEEEKATSTSTSVIKETETVQ
jgi:hypothetical protein